MVRMMTAAVGAAAFLLGGTGGSAAAMQACSTRAQILGALTKRYGEMPVAMGIASNGGLVEVLASPADGGSKPGTWSIIVTMPTGISCLLATGESWETLLAVPVRGEPS